MPDTKDTLSPITIALHWLIALTIITLMAVGWYMQTYEVYSLYGWHKSFGILIFAFIAVRVVWRLMQGFPEPVSPMDKLQHMVSKVVHWVLLLGTLAFPLSGMMMSGAGGHGLDLFGVELLAKNVDAVTGKVAPLNADVASMGKSVHGIMLWVFIVAIALHIAGALKHHLFDKDRTLLRMLGRTSAK